MNGWNLSIGLALSHALRGALGARTRSISIGHGGPVRIRMDVPADAGPEPPLLDRIRARRTVAAQRIQRCTDVRGEVGRQRERIEMNRRWLERTAVRVQRRTAMSSA
jgi:hypothetical protein